MWLLPVSTRLPACRGGTGLFNTLQEMLRYAALRIRIWVHAVRLYRSTASSTGGLIIPHALTGNASRGTGAWSRWRSCIHSAEMQILGRSSQPMHGYGAVQTSGMELHAGMDGSMPGHGRHSRNASTMDMQALAASMSDDGNEVFDAAQLLAPSSSSHQQPWDKQHADVEAPYLHEAGVDSSGSKFECLSDFEPLDAELAGEGADVASERLRVESDPRVRHQDAVCIRRLRKVWVCCESCMQMCLHHVPKFATNSPACTQMHIRGADLCDI